MATIHFKATRRKHSSGYSYMEKRGDLQFDQDEHSNDVIILYNKKGGRIIIDHDYKTKEFAIKFTDEDFELNR